MSILGKPKRMFRMTCLVVSGTIFGIKNLNSCMKLKDKDLLCLACKAWIDDVCMMSGFLFVKQ